MNEKLKQSLDMKIQEFPHKKTTPSEGTDEALMLKHIDQVKALRGLSEEYRRKGFGYVHTWREIATIFSSCCEKQYSAEYIRKLYYTVSTKYRRENEGR